MVWARRRRLVALLLTTLVAGCSTIRVDYDYDPSADFSAYRSWSWLPRSPSETGDSRIHNALVDERVREAVESVLAAKGYQSVAAGAGDFGLSYHVAVEGKMDVQTIDDYYAYGSPRAWRWGPGPGYSRTYVRYYDEGTLMLDIVDLRTQKLVWRGSAQAEVSRSSDPERRSQRVHEAVQKMLESFPPS